VERNKSISITVLSIYSIAIGLYSLVGFIAMVSNYGALLMSAKISRIPEWPEHVYIFSYFICGVLFVISGINLLNYKNWARKTLVYLFAYLLAGKIIILFLGKKGMPGSLVFVIEIGTFIAAFIYLHQRRVREQFK